MGEGCEMLLLQVESTTFNILKFLIVIVFNFFNIFNNIKKKTVFFH